MRLDLIPAHDGSKRMANNNAPFCGKRMIKDVLVDEHLIIPAGWLKL